MADRYKKRKPGLRKRRVGYRVKKAEWIDPFPGINGTKPEKMVLAELVARRVPFYFQYPFAETALNPGENWRLDFAVPSSKIVIEVNGDYWHGSKEAQISDARRYAILTYLGWRVAVWWESEILVNLQGLFAQWPDLDHPPNPGPPINMENAHDDLKAMRRVAAGRRRGYSVGFRASNRTKRRRSRG